MFPGGTKIDAGPLKLGEVQTNKSKKDLHSNLVPFFAQIQVKSKKKKQKKLSLKFGPSFCPKLGEEQKKKVFTQIWSHFFSKFR